MDRYEEALGRAREMYQKMTAQGVVGMAENIAKIFPELAESEDERILKDIISAFKIFRAKNCYPGNEHPTFNGCDVKKALAWLEKQKEQKPANIPSSGIGAMGTTPPAYKLDVKPAEWSEEDEDKIDSIIGIICSERECAKIANIGEEKEDNSAFYNDLVLFLKSLRPQPHWKPSEEQMEALNKARNDNVNSAFNLAALDQLYIQLQKLM